MDGVLAAFGRRPVAAVGLLTAVAWIVVVAVESATTYPWDRGGWYAVLVTASGLILPGVAGVAALVWLLERAAD
jgi:hypothetical protein